MTLETTEISKTYRGRKVVDNVSLWVEQGEVVGLLGPNGAGKTTSFYMIVGLVTPIPAPSCWTSQTSRNVPMYSARATRHQLSSAGTLGVPQAVGGGQSDGHPADPAAELGASGANGLTADRTTGSGDGPAQQRLHAVGRRAAQGGDCPLAMVIEPSSCCWMSRSRASIRSRCWSCRRSSSICTTAASAFW